MRPNPVLRRLGFSDHDRVVLIHTDDIGMCQATVDAFADLADFGLISCASTMVPCPWFPLAADFCRRHPAVDMGVHLDLTCEWDLYRWGPISTRAPGSGLIDREGYLYRTSKEVQQYGDPEAVSCELQAQVERALAAGIDVTHVDTHMGTVGHARFIQAYLQLVLRYHVPAMLPRLDQAAWEARGVDSASASMAVEALNQIEESGVPVLDGMLMLPLEQPAERIEQAKRAFDALPVGLTHFIIHPAKDTPELRALANTWPARVADYQAFMSEELRDYVRQSDLQVIGYRALRELVRKSAE